MSLRIRLAPGVTFGRTGLRVTEHVGPARISAGQSGIFAHAALGPLLWNRTIR